MFDSSEFPKFLVSPERRERAYGQVYPEYRLPAQSHCEDPAQYETDYGPADTCYKINPDCSSPLVWGKCVCQNSSVVCPDQRRSHSLDQAEEDEHCPGEGEAAES